MTVTLAKTNSKPLPHRFYRAPNGSTYSFFSTYRPEGSELVTEGWTVSHIDGTTGTGKKPFATEAEAQAWCDANPNFPGMGRLYD